MPVAKAITIHWAILIAKKIFDAFVIQTNFRQSHFSLIVSILLSLEIVVEEGKQKVENENDQKVNARNHMKNARFISEFTHNHCGACNAVSFVALGQQRNSNNNKKYDISFIINFNPFQSCRHYFPIMQNTNGQKQKSKQQWTKRKNTCREWVFCFFEILHAKISLDLLPFYYSVQ